MLTTVVVFFFACMMPFKIFILWIITLDDDVGNVISMETYYLLLYFCRVMFYINSAINPILYNIMSSRFREGFRKVFHCIEWPLTPQRFRQAYPSGNPVAGSSTEVTGIRRKTTVSTSFSLQVNASHPPAPQEMGLKSHPPPVIAGCQKTHSTPTDFVEKPAEDEKDKPEVDSEDDINAEEFSTFGKQKKHQQSFCHHEKNIVFIEERKILVIPTTTSSASSNNATPSSSHKTTDI